MSNVTTIDKEINNYLTQLNPQQKKAVLTVVKTFAQEQEEYDYWNDKSFIAELDRRTAEYENGKARLYTIEELEAGARKTFKDNE